MNVNLRTILMTVITTTVLSTSLAAVEPRIVKPSLDDSDVVVADLVITDRPYAADPTGVRDCKTGGGVLYFPAGKYRFKGTLTLVPFQNLS